MDTATQKLIDAIWQSNLPQTVALEIERRLIAGAADPAANQEDY